MSISKLLMVTISMASLLMANPPTVKESKKTSGGAITVGKPQNELVPIILGGAMIMKFSSELNVTSKQSEAFSNRIYMSMLPKIAKLMNRAMELENTVRKGMYDEAKTVEELKPYLDEIADLKKQATMHRINMYLTLRDILTKEQYDKGMKILKAKAKAKANKGK
ncbi:MAG: hypothetical protein HF962_01310 [Sulfurovum sp.]|nr:hypothetical protein [Sulfurovum sp.]